MDGVLVDAREWHYVALNQALGHFGVAINRYEHLTVFDGLPTRKKLEMLSLERGLPRTLHALVNDLKQEYTMQIIAVQCRPTFAHEFALSSLKSSGRRLAVASNSIRRTVDMMMQRTHLARYLDVSLSAEDVASAKPDPSIYLEAMRRLGTAPESTLVVEDNAHGVAAAKASGAHVHVVADPHDVHWPGLQAALDAIEQK